MKLKNFALCFLILVISLSSSTIVSAQVKIQGKLLSSENAKALVGGHVFLYDENGSLVKIETSDNEGSFVLDKIRPGSYRIKLSFVGFEEKEQAIVLRDDVDLGTIILQFKENIISEVEVYGKVPAVSMSGDTLQFNADAYKTMPDASASDLAEKLPGVVIEDNKVQAQGEDVKEVLVDGRPFFGQNPATTLNALPAEVVEKIQIFDKESDQAEFTGFSTGETTKTMNIITRARMQNGSFGKVYAGYGYPDKFIFNGNYNIFNGDQRITLVGLSNNINQQNFAIEDLLGIMAGGGRRGAMGRGSGGSRGGGSPGGGGIMGGGSIQDFMVNQQGGISQTNAGGINFSDI